MKCLRGLFGEISGGGGDFSRGKCDWATELTHRETDRQIAFESYYYTVHSESKKNYATAHSFVTLSL